MSLNHPKKPGSPDPAGVSTGVSQQQGTPQRMREAMAGEWEHMHSTVEKKINGAWDKWASCDVFRKQFYYFTIFAHILPIETCSEGLALILLISESL